MLIDSNYTKNLHLQKEVCQVRTQCLSEVSYDLTLNLPRGEFYSGMILITFKVNQLPQNDDVSIDFRGMNIAEFLINDQDCVAYFKDHKVRLPLGNLLLGQRNTAKLYFLNRYRTDGVGLATYTEKACG